MRLSIFNAKKVKPLEYSKKYNTKNEWCKNYSDDKQYFKSFLGKDRVFVIIWPLIGHTCVINFTC